MTRTTLIWFAGAVVTGVVAAGLHLLRSEVGGAHDSLALGVAAWFVTALTGLMVNRGILTAATEQDDAKPKPRGPVETPGRGTR